MSECTRIISFSPPDISEEEINEVAEALRSGWITTGPRTKLLEKNIAEWIGTEKCVCLNSQTACAEMALRVLGIGQGDEVIVPAYTYTASASVIDHVGAKIVMIDSQKNSLEMDYEQFVKSRHSIRHFNSTPVKIDDLKEAINLARYTPSACNRQGWRTRIIVDRDIIRGILENQNGNRGFGQEIDKLLVIPPFQIPQTV